MTSGTNILSVSEKLKLPVVPGVSAALSKSPIPACWSSEEEHTFEFQPPFRFWGVWCYPGDTAGIRLVTGQRTVCPPCRGGAVTLCSTVWRSTCTWPVMPQSTVQDNSFLGTISPWLAGGLFFKKEKSYPDISNLFLQQAAGVTQGESLNISGLRFLISKAEDVLSLSLPGRVKPIALTFLSSTPRPVTCPHQLALTLHTHLWQAGHSIPHLLSDL